MTTAESKRCAGCARELTEQNQGKDYGFCKKCCGESGPKAPAARLTRDGMDGPQALEFAMYVFCNFITRPDLINSFGRELGLDPQQIQQVARMALSSSKRSPDDPVDLTKLGL